jgi:hypothetical protein
MHNDLDDDDDDDDDEDWPPRALAHPVQAIKSLNI